MKVRFTRTALADIDGILAYLAERNMTAAHSLAARIDQLIGYLSDNPLMAQQTVAVGVRRLPLGRYPYVIFYTVEEDEVVILHVRHAAQRSHFG